MKAGVEVSYSSVVSVKAEVRSIGVGTFLPKIYNRIASVKESIVITHFSYYEQSAFSKSKSFFVMAAVRK